MLLSLITMQLHMKKQFQSKYHIIAYNLSNLFHNLLDIFVTII